MNDQPSRIEPIAELQRLTDPVVQGSLQSDAELLTRFVESGSRAAIETIIQRYAGMVASVCRCTVSDPASAEDAFQATFLVLLKSAKKIHNRRSVAAWLHGVAFRTACRLRKQRSAHATEQSANEVIALNRDEDPINVLARKLELEALDQELEKLPAPVREILVEHYLLGYTAPQIAARTALSVSAVEGRIRRGRYALLRQLAKRGISLTVLVAASTWFQQHLQATEAQEWTEAFLDTYLPQDAATSFNSSTQPTQLEPSSDISSLVYGEMNMFSTSLIKVAFPSAAALVIGGLLSLNLLGEGDQLSLGTADSGDTSTVPTLPVPTPPVPNLPEESSMIMAQMGMGGFGVRTAVAPQDPAVAPANPNPQATTQADTGPANAVQANPVQANATAQPNASAQPNQTTPPQPAASAKPAAPRKPIEWQKPEGEPPTWLADGMAELAESERELRDLVRSKLRTRIDINFQETPFNAAITDVSEQAGLEIILNKTELENMSVDIEAPISMSGVMSVREFLRRLPQNFDGPTGYIVREKSIEITSQENADAEPAIRYYDLAFVLPNDSHLDSVMNAIQMSIDPDTWLSAGGSNSISTVGSMLIISCPEVIHQRIEIMLARIASINKKNLEVEAPRRDYEYYPGGMGGMGGGMGGMGGGGMGGMF